jgi:threonyl-tRNA synthetase
MTSKIGLVRGKDYWFRLSLGDRTNKKKYYDAPEKWEIGEATLKKVLDEIKAPYEEALDEAAFYGPKIDIQMRNANGKEDTAFTVQYDICLPARFELEYTNENGQPEQPVVIHRSSIGAIERTLAFLIERYAGAFPLWLSPVQVTILSVNKDHHEYCTNLGQKMRNQKIRVEIDNANETVGNKIRKATKDKTPYILVIGEKEIKSEYLMVRVRGEEQLLEISIDDFITRVLEEIKEKK